MEKTVKLRHDAASRAIAGQSSGGICAFTVAWERPERVQQGALVDRAASPTSPRATTATAAATTTRRWCGATPKKPIRVILQDGANDLDNVNGNWFLANQTLAKSLEFAGYDYAPTGAPASTATHTAGRFSGFAALALAGVGRPITA